MQSTYFVRLPVLIGTWLWSRVWGSSTPLLAVGRLAPPLDATLVLMTVEQRVFDKGLRSDQHRISVFTVEFDPPPSPP